MCGFSVHELNKPYVLSFESVASSYVGNPGRRRLQTRLTTLLLQHPLNKESSSSFGTLLILGNATLDNVSYNFSCSATAQQNCKTSCKKKWPSITEP